MIRIEQSAPKKAAGMGQEEMPKDRPSKSKDTGTARDGLGLGSGFRSCKPYEQETIAQERRHPGKAQFW